MSNPILLNRRFFRIIVADIEEMTWNRSEAFGSRWANRLIPASAALSRNAIRMAKSKSLQAARETD